MVEEIERDRGEEMYMTGIMSRGPAGPPPKKNGNKERKGAKV